jgi:hypothetical protein
MHKRRCGEEGKNQRSAPPLGASTQFDQKRNFGEPSFMREIRSLWSRLSSLPKSEVGN